MHHLAAHAVFLHHLPVVGIARAHLPVHPGVIGHLRRRKGGRGDYRCAGKAGFPGP
jgi:hypothetical protein